MTALIETLHQAYFLIIHQFYTSVLSYYFKAFYEAVKTWYIEVMRNY